MKATVGRIWEAASTDPSRPVLAHVAFDAKQKTLTATNSYVLAQVPCEVEAGDESGLIPAEAIKAAKGESLRIADGKATLKLRDGERSWTLLANGTFPDVEKILNGYEKIDAPFGVNPKLLKELGDALGADSMSPIALHPTHPLKGILATGVREGIGVIMPVRLVGAPSLSEKPFALPDVTNDAAVIAGIEAAIATLGRRRGKKKAAQAFRDALVGWAA